MTNTHRADWLDNLRNLLRESGSNRNDQAIVAITVCITEKLDTAKRIYEVAARLGFNTRHIAMILKRDTGGNPELHRWQRDDAGHYRLHE